MVSGIAAAEAAMHHLGHEALTTGQLVHRGLEEAVSELPDVQIDADTTDADRELADLRRRLAALNDVRIDTDVSTREAAREIDDIRARLAELAATHPDV